MPFNTVSMTGTGVVIAVITFLFQFFEIEVSNEIITTAVEAVLTLVSFVLLIWGQVRRPDLKAGIVRKN